MAPVDETSQIAMSPRRGGRQSVAVLVGVSEGTPVLTTLAEGDSVVGRDPACDLILEVRGVSRRHAKLLRVDGTVSVVDLASRNGTYVNDVRVEAVELNEGDALHFGPYAAFRFTRTLVSDVVDGGMSTPEVALEGLTPREAEVAREVATGRTNAAVAERLGIKPRTVATHLERIYAKLELSSRAQLIRAVFQSTPPARTRD